MLLPCFSFIPLKFLLYTCILVGLDINAYILASINTIIHWFTLFMQVSRPRKSLFSIGGYISDNRRLFNFHKDIQSLFINGLISIHILHCLFQHKYVLVSLYLSYFRGFTNFHLHPHFSLQTLAYLSDHFIPSSFSLKCFHLFRNQLVSIHMYIYWLVSTHMF